MEAAFLEDMAIDFWHPLVRDAARGALRRPGSSLVVVLALALGIGATTSMFSVVDAVLFRPLQAERPKELVRVVPPARAVPGRSVANRTKTISDIRATESGRDHGRGRTVIGHLLKCRAVSREPRDPAARLHEG